MEIIKIPIEDITPDPNNAKDHPGWQIEQIKNSVEQFGNLDPIGVWGDRNLIVEGHGRYEALKELGYHEAECIRLDWLTEEERRAYALAHNKLTMNSGFIPDALDMNLDAIGEIDMSLFGFRTEDWFQGRDRWDGSKQEGNEEYNQFLEKFEPKKTTDDCYTPDNIYDAVADWVVKEYGVDRSTFVRPFYPGGDYENEKYLEGCVVVDNPPFSILAQICRFYIERNIKFFLFAPTMTLFSADCPEICHICANGEIVYENGANVNTGFKTNLEDGIAVRTAPELTQAIAEANAINTQKNENLLKYAYPSNVITAAKVSNWSEGMVDFRVPRGEAAKISALDAQKEKNIGIFGGVPIE